jgi:hypothetical protein
MVVRKPQSDVGLLRPLDVTRTKAMRARLAASGPLMELDRLADLHVRLKLSSGDPPRKIAISPARARCHEPAQPNGAISVGWCGCGSRIVSDDSDFRIFSDIKRRTYLMYRPPWNEMDSSSAI